MAKTTSTHRSYWQAQSLVEHGLSQFQAAVEQEDRALQRGSFYRLARYYGRTIHILNSALNDLNEDLAQAALHNFQTLHRAIFHMHQAAPDLLPLPFALGQAEREIFARDLIMRVLGETPRPLALPDIASRVNHLDLLGKVSQRVLRNHLNDLVKAGHVTTGEKGYLRTSRTYVEEDIDIMSLRALTGARHYRPLLDAGFSELQDLDDRPGDFQDLFLELTGLTSPDTAALFVEAARLLMDTSMGEARVWRHADLLHTPIPRPYQRAAFAAFNRGDYQGLIVDAPTGSGKTMVGMMCIQDWFRSLQAGQSILILVPTSNYQQQWVSELSYHDIGLRISPELIFSGTPAGLGSFQDQTGEHPAIMLITYAALAHLASGAGKGGFDVASVEMFLQQANVQYVIMDEVHKMVENMQSVSAEVARLLVSWQQDGSLRGLIGFSGTAVAYRGRFDSLGLDLVYSVPMDALVAAGFVAPYAELGVPFAFSRRERRIRQLLNDYKINLRAYFELLGPGQLREWFSQVPLEDRLWLAHMLFNMERGHREWQPALTQRFNKWEQGRSDALALNEIRLVILLQIARGWSDEDLVAQSGADSTAFASLRQQFEKIRLELLELVYLPKTVLRLQAENFTTTLDTGRLRGLPEEIRAAQPRMEEAKNIIATTITGLYDGLSEWYWRMGEGRVDTIEAVIEAERAVREVKGIIVFDRGRRIHWREGLSAPGYVGVGGLFGQMLGDTRFTALAVLSNEMYLPYSEKDPLTGRIAQYIEKQLMREELAEAIFGLATQGLELSSENLAELSARFHQALDRYLSRLKNVHAARPGEFHRRVIRPLRRVIQGMDLGLEGDRLLARLDRYNPHLARLVQTFFDYALLASYFREARVAELEQVSGQRQSFFVVTMSAAARRKQLMYDLTSRIVDEESLPINLVIVSDWARTGWNVVKPNLLIDATATRNVTAWQQLRGRAIRAWPTWNNDCYRLITLLLGHHELDLGGEEETIDETHSLDRQLLDLLEGIATTKQQSKLVQGGAAALSFDERYELAIALMEKRNKVTHIYELVKASGSTRQVIHDRSTDSWKRRQNIAAKHNREISVNPFNGEKLTGAGHAPLLYAKDPRDDVPADLGKHLKKQIKGKDDVIVGGWLG
jgi:superfamily II DNA or RNA helicase/DNA-binding transcriptional ArsR family regulator